MQLKYRTVLYILACLFLCGRVWAQEQQHYVYIQSEKGQPFYIKLNGKVLSSTERGYIILPRLESGTTPLTVGFPKDDGPEQKFYVKIARNDQGYLLKKAGESGYTLYNLQTFREIKADNGDGSAAALAAAEPEPEPATAVAASSSEDTARKEMMGNLQKELETTFANKAIVTGPGKPVAAATKSGNSFASALDKVVVTGDDRDVPLEEVKPVVAPADPAATAEPVAKKGNRKRKGAKAPLTEEEQAILDDVLAQESKTAASEAAAAEALKESSIPVEEPEATPKKAKQRKKRAGDPDFIEFQDDDATPVAAAIPAPVEEAAVTPSPDMPAIADETPAPSKKKRRKVFDDTEHPANIITDSSGYGIAVTRDEAPVKSRKRKKQEEADMTVDPATGAVSSEVSSKKEDSRLINSDCENVMNDDTFRKVLRKFVSAKSDDGMIDVFRKQTRNYCMETSQIRTLAQLVTAEDARYRLLDLAYSKTLDTEKYGSLENLLNESYYKGRFKAMLHK